MRLRRAMRMGARLGKRPRPRRSGWETVKAREVGTDGLKKLNVLLEESLLAEKDV